MYQTRRTLSRNARDVLQALFLVLGYLNQYLWLLSADVAAFSNRHFGKNRFLSKNI